RQADRAVLPQYETQRITLVECCRVNATFSDEAVQHFPQAFRLAESRPHGKHHQYADIPLDGLRKNALTGGLVEDVKADHHHVPDIILQCALQHHMLRVCVKALGNADIADFARLLHRLQHRYNLVKHVIVILGSYSMQVINVDIIHTEIS